MKNWFNVSSYHVKIKGNNFINFFNILIKHNIEIYNIKRKEVAELEGIVLQKDYKNIVSIIKHLGFSLTIVQAFGWSKLYRDAKYRFGIVIGVFMSLLLLIVLNQFTFNYKVMGLESISYNEVEACIENFGIKKHTINNFNIKQLEQHIENNISNVSMVSVIKKGTTLIINIKEKLPDVLQEHQPIVAEHNMLITKLNVFAGFSNLVVGDSVMKGDVLVHPYTFDGAGKIVKCKPVADVEGKVWFSASEVISTHETITERTGKVIKNSYYSIGQGRYFQTNYANKFALFEKQESTVVINNFLIPVKLHTTIYYECIEKTITRDFEKEKELLTNKLIKDAKAQVPANILIENEKVVISNYDDKHVISVYLQATIAFKGE